MGCGASKVAAAQPDPPLRTVSPPTHDADGKPRRPSDTEVNSFRAAAGVSSQGLAVSSATIARMSGEWEQQESFKAKDVVDALSPRIAGDSSPPRAPSPEIPRSTALAPAAAGGRLMIGRSASHGGQLRPSQLRGAVSERWSNNDGGADEIALISKPTVDAPVGLELEARGQQVQVVRVTAGGLAEASGAIFEGDTIVSINNQECGWQARGAEHAAKLLAEAEGHVRVSVRRGSPESRRQSRMSQDAELLAATAAAAANAGAPAPAPARAAGALHPALGAAGARPPRAAAGAPASAIIEEEP